jgi:plastocyanin
MIPRMRLSFLLALPLSALPWSSLLSASVDGTITFTKTPPVAVVVWDATDTSLAPGAPAVISQKNRIFSPMIAVLPPQAVIDFKNDDDQQHNVFASDKKAGLDVDFGLSKPSEVHQQSVTWPVGTAIRFGCKIHPQMQAWVLCSTSARHQVVAVPEGATQVTFSLPQATASSRIQVWSPRGEAVDAAFGEVGTELLFKGKPCGQVTLRVVP